MRVVLEDLQLNHFNTNRWDALRLSSSSIADCGTLTDVSHQAFNLPGTRRSHWTCVWVSGA
jgi:hypothetical protein